MEDPFANAWGEPATTSKALPVRWPSANDDDEEDITIPSWDAPVHWDSASDQNSLWSSTRSPALDKFPGWHPEPSPYDDLPLGKPVTENRDDEEPPPSEPEPDTHSDVSEPEPDPVPPFEPQRIISSPTFKTPPISPPPTPLPPGSPDAFGTFESGIHETMEADAWTPSRAAFAPEADDAAAWGGTAWGAEHNDEPQNDSHVVDEWEAAKQKKAMQDKHVPPELLASILLQFTELSGELYPTPPPSDPDDYRVNRHKGLDGIDSLTPTTSRLLPTDLILPALLPFPKSTIAKRTADALRLSRNAAFVRVSPLAHYAASRGSTAWEASVARRPEVVGEPDLLPPGWRVVEKVKDEGADKEKEKKRATGHGGLLSFFGRRTGTPPVVERPSSPASGSASISSPRASIDSVRSPPKSPTTSIKSPTTSTTAASPITSAANTPLSTPIPPAVEVAKEAEPETTTAAPSAVSRFLGRFGRKASVAEQQGLATLSSGDFDFLADIEGASPGASAHVDVGNLLDGNDFTSSGLFDAPVPLPTKLAPPPRVVPIPAPVDVPPKPVPMSRQSQNAATTSRENGHKPRVDVDAVDALGTFATISPPSHKPLAPSLLAHSISTPTPQSIVPMVPSPAPAPSAAPAAAESDIDFAAWGFDDEEVGKEKSGAIVRAESEPVRGYGGVRPSTTVAQPFNVRAPTNGRGVAPPPRRAPTAIMSSGSSKPAVVPKLDASFNFALPQRTQPSAVPVIPTLPPPGSASTAPASASLFDDDDEFSDFHTPAQLSPQTSKSSAFYDASFSSSTSSDRGLFSSSSSTSIPSNLFDDFDDFMQVSPHTPATLRTPSPPRPPAKSPQTRAARPKTLQKRTSTPPPPSDPDDTPLAITSSALRAKRTADRQRALSLVESAAASSGVRWPAPASPLPEVLSPPPDTGDPFGLGGSSSSMQSQQAAFLDERAPQARFSPPPPIAPKAFPPPPAAGLPSRGLSPALPNAFPPPPGSGLPARVFTPPVPMTLPPPPNTSGKGAPPARAFSPPTAGFPPPPGRQQTPTSLPISPPPPLLSASSNKSGGLSAQDLSFFEGL